MTSRGFDLGIGVCLTFLICFGMVGNIISLVVWTKGRRCKNLPGGIYLRALAIADSVVLCVSATDMTAGLLFEVRPRNLNIVFCKVETTVFHFGLIASTWIVVCFTAERTISVCQLKTSATKQSKASTISIIVVLTVVSFLLNIPYAVGCRLLIKSDGKYKHVSVVTSNIDVFSKSENTTDNTTEQFEYCGAELSSFIFKYEKEYHFWFLDFVLIFLIPTAVISLCNILVLCVIAFRQKGVQMKKNSRRNGITARALAVSLVHCVSSAPFSIAALVPGFIEKAYIREIGHYYYAGVLISFCTFVNHGVNFILYSFFGTDFRLDTVELFGRRPRRVRPEASTWDTSLRRLQSVDDTGRLSILS